MKSGLLFFIKKIFDENEDYRVRLYLLIWVGSIIAIITVILSGLILLFVVFGLV